MTSNGTRRTVPVLIAAILGIALGYLIGRSTRPALPGPTLTPVVIYVGPTERDVNPDPATIGPSNYGLWHTKPSGGRLLIVFKRTGFPPSVNIPPFSGMLPNGNDFNVPCSGDTCTSGPVNPNLPQAGGPYIYKYTQILNGNSYDGRIIIQW